MLVKAAMRHSGERINMGDKSGYRFKRQGSGKSLPGGLRVKHFSFNPVAKVWNGIPGATRLHVLTWWCSGWGKCQSGDYTRVTQAGVNPVQIGVVAVALLIWRRFSSRGGPGNSGHAGG
jgi:hypothetical protein